MAPRGGSFGGVLAASVPRLLVESSVHGTREILTTGLWRSVGHTEPERSTHRAWR